ncbi:MAG TPA: ABC transporter substrate-binding protein [Candidatus Binatia bacterium]|jgi:multiple sugar transport system substrate-binding protein|nr:ABC transporter substrate-binding protein [Candidatus Binatia bacterium]
MLVCCLGCVRGQPGEDSLRLVFKHSRLLSREEPLRVLLDQFRRAHPQVRVQEEILPASSDEQHLFYATQLEAEATDFDVFTLDVIWVPEFRRAGWLHELTPYLGPQGLTDFFSGPVQAATYKGRIYTVPWFVDAGALYYRKDLLDKYGLSPPQTFAELTQAAHLILERENNPRLTGFVWQGKQYEGLVCVALEFIRAYGGEVLDERGESLLTHPATVAGVEALRALIMPERVSPPWVTTADEETARHVFRQGEAVFMRNWPYAWALLNAEESPVRGHVGVAALPGSEKHPGVPTLGGWHLGINRFSKHPDLAWQLISFLTSRESQNSLAAAGGLKPSRVSAYEDPRAQAEDSSAKLFFSFLQSARPRPVTPFYLMLSQVLQGELSAVVTGIKPAKMALQDAEQQVQRILALDFAEERHAQSKSN